MNSLAISIIVWNNPDDVIECAESLLRQTVGDGLKILFVDNNSSRMTVERLKTFIDEKNDTRLVMIHTGANNGTAGGFTTAAQWAETENIQYIGALNADAVADEHWCEALFAELEAHKGAGIAIGIVLDREGKRTDTTGEQYTTWGIPGPRGRDKPADTIPKEAGDIFGATGGAFLCRTSIYSQIGYYDDEMFMYYEDVDFSFRAQLHGYTVRYTPDAVVYHKRGASSGTVPGLAIYNTFKNLPVLYLKNVPRDMLMHIGLRFTLAYVLILGNAIAHGKGGPALRGWLRSISLLRHSLRERRKIQSTKTVTSEYISSIIIHDIPEDQTGLRKFRKVFTGK